MPTISASVRSLFLSHLPKYEHRSAVMWRDPISVVVAVGHRLPTENDAFKLSWRRPNKTQASQREVVAAWQAAQEATPLLAPNANVDPSAIRLAEADVDNLVLQQLETLATALATRWKAWPRLADSAQLALMDLAWVLGIDGETGLFSKKWATFTSLVDVSDWTRCAKSCSVVGGSFDRNAARQQLFEATELDSLMGW